MFARSLTSSEYPKSLAATRSSNVMKNSRGALSMSNEINLTSAFHLPQDPKDKEGVELLLGIATIVSKEIANSDKEIFDDGNVDDFLTLNKNSFVEPAVTIHQASTSTGPKEFPPSFNEGNNFAWHRIRTVSIDNEHGSPRRSPIGQKNLATKTKSVSLPAVVTPVDTRLRTIRKPSIKLLANKGKKDRVKFSKTSAHVTHNTNTPNVMSQHKKKAMIQSNATTKAITVIHRKKFSWKNYPGASFKELFDRIRMKVCRYLANKCALPFCFVLISFLCDRTRGVFGCQSRRVFASLGSELYNSTEEIQ